MLEKYIKSKLVPLVGILKNCLSLNLICGNFFEIVIVQSKSCIAIT
jgi:hypothetical protein